MSGHSKWSTIKRKKAATDAKRGKLFTRFLKEIQVAAKIGGGSIDGNARLKSAVAAAKAQSVPADNIEKAIKRGIGAIEGDQFEEVSYEGFGPGGVGVLIHTLTNNKNRTVSDIRHAFTRCNGSLGGAHSVSRLFTEKGIIVVPRTAGLAEEAVFNTALEAGALDITDEGEAWEVVTSPKDFETVKGALEVLGGPFEGAVRQVPESTVIVAGQDAQNLLKLLDILDEIDDVQSVISNFDMDERELQNLS